MTKNTTAYMWTRLPVSTARSTLATENDHLISLPEPHRDTDSRLQSEPLCTRVYSYRSSLYTLYAHDNQPCSSKASICTARHTEKIEVQLSHRTPSKRMRGAETEARVSSAHAPKSHTTDTPLLTFGRHARVAWSAAADPADGV
jgi:hypothetical protein